MIRATPHTNEAAPTASAVEAISMDESHDLNCLEETIQQGLQTFMEVGEALAEIRDRKLYRIEHATFGEYCREKWNMGRTYAHRLMAAASVTAMLPTGNKPTSERQARPLTTLAEPRQQREAWQAAGHASGGKPTAQQVEAAVKEVKGRATTHSPMPRAKPERKGGEDCDPPNTPLRWLTHWWGLASADERKTFDNFRAGSGGGK